MHVRETQTAADWPANRYSLSLFFFTRVASTDVVVGKSEEGWWKIARKTLKRDN